MSLRKSDLAQGFLVADQNEVGVHLQDAGGDLRRDGAEERLFDDVGLALAVGDHQDLAGLHDRLDAHGVGLLGDQVGVAVKEALVGLDGLLLQYKGEISTFYLQSGRFEIGRYIRSVDGIPNLQIAVMVFTKQLANI